MVSINGKTHGFSDVEKLSKVLDKALAKAQELNNTTVSPKADASALERLTAAAQKAGREIGSISKVSEKANKVTTLNNGTDDLNDRDDRSE